MSTSIFHLSEEQVASIYDGLSQEDESGGRWDLLDTGQRRILLGYVAKGLEGSSDGLRQLVVALLNAGLDDHRFVTLEMGDITSPGTCPQCLDRTTLTLPADLTGGQDDDTTITR